MESLKSVEIQLETIWQMVQQTYLQYVGLLI
jgi:hypothetical protein